MSTQSKIFEFKQLIRSIKSMEDVTNKPEDKKIVQDLIITLRYICEFDILSAAYDNSEGFNSIIPRINAKLVNLDNEIRIIKDKYKRDGGLTPFDMRKLQALRMSFNRYNDIKDAIETRNFEHYVASMNRNLSNAKQVISVCSSALAIGEENFSELFGAKENDGVINKSYLDALYRLINNKQLINELQVYFRKERSVAADNTQYETDKKFLEYLRLAQRYFPQLRGYLTTRSLLGESGRNKLCLLKSRLSKSKLALDELSQGFLANVKNIKAINELETLIARDEAELKKLEEKIPKIKSNEDYLREVGLGPIIDNFDYNFDDKTNTPEQLAVDYLKINLSRYGLDIAPAEEKVSQEMALLSAKLSKRDTTVNYALDNLSSYARSLVTNYHDDVIKVLDIVDGKNENGITPLLAAYVLKALVDAKEIGYKDLNNIIKVYDANGIKSLIDSYQRLAANTTNNANTLLTDIENRTMLDVHPFGDLKIR